MDRKSTRYRALLSVAVLLILIVSLFFLSQHVLFAYTNPHIGPSYELDTDACAQCHRSHTGGSEYLVYSIEQSAQCFTCHNGTGSIYNIESEFRKQSRHSIGGVDSDALKQCPTCHEAHLHSSISKKALNDPRNTRVTWSIVDDNDPEYDSTSTPSGIYVWCETCHVSSADTPIGSLLLNKATTAQNYVPYDVNVISLTSHSQVSDNDDTSSASYWQYFTRDTTNSAFGYNDASAVGQSSHGRARLSSSAAAGMKEWKGPYEPDYPAISCTECHANHGSSQPWMISESIEVEDETTTTDYDMSTWGGQKAFCESCHVGTYSNCDFDIKCTDCHRHGDRF